MLHGFFSDRRLALLRLGEDAAVPQCFSDARAEHLATRSRAGLFDFSFMGLWEVRGPRAREYLERVQTRNLSLLPPGRLLYTLLLREDASVLNDATLWCHAPDRYWLFTGRRSDRAWLEQQLRGGDTPLECLSGRHAILALQGPRSPEILRRALGAAPAGGLPYFSFLEAHLAGVPALIARLGYSGETGFEIVVPAQAGEPVWNELLRSGAEAGVRECGFDAANSLRVESGYVLFSNELGVGADPFELGLQRLVTGREFIGAAALRRKRPMGPRRLLIGLVPEQARRSPGSLPEALLTSEAYSPVFGRLLGLGFAPAHDSAPGTVLQLADGRLAHCSRLPFYDPGRVLPRRP
jgi:aminomethyltransferase